MRYEEIWEAAKRRHRQWGRLDRAGPIVLLGGNSHEWIIDLLAGLRARRQVIPLSARMPESILRQRILSLRPCLVVNQGGAQHADFGSMEDLATRNGVNNSNNSIGLITSGTSGEGDLVALSDDNIIANLVQIGEAVSEEMIHAEDVSFSILPWSHCYGLTCELLFLITRGATLHMPSTPMEPRTMARELSRARPTLLFAVPLLLERILQRLRFLESHRWARFLSRPILHHQVLGGRLKAVSVGGSRCSPEIIESFEETLGVRVFQGYGSTECSPMIALNTDRHHRRGSVGRVLPGVEVRVHPRTQEILVRGDNVSQTLAAERYDEENFLRTGDTGALDEDGFLFLTDRLSEHFKLTNGLFVHPRRIEIVYEPHRPPNVGEWMILPDRAHRSLVLVGFLLQDDRATPMLSREELRVIGRARGLREHEIPMRFVLLSARESQEFLTEKQTPRRKLLLHHLHRHNRI